MTSTDDGDEERNGNETDEETSECKERKSSVWFKTEFEMSLYDLLFTKH